MLDYIYLSFIAACIICGLVFTKRSSHIAYKLFLFFLIVTFANETVCYYLKIKNTIHTNFLYNIYYYFRFTFLGIIFYSLLYKNRAAIIFIRAFWLLSVFLFFIFYQLYHGIFNQLHTRYLMLGGIFVIINCLLLFYQSVKDERVISPFEFPFFICATALFLYFLGILPFFGVINLLVKKYPSLATSPAIVAKSLSIVFYSLISFDYFLQWKRTTSS